MAYAHENDIPLIYYYQWMIISFILCLLIHHVLSPLLFRRHNKAYREFPHEKRMEWDSRLVSSIHATAVSVICISTLVSDKKIWEKPLSYASHGGLVALSISIGYFLCDMVSMPFYWRGKDLYIFLLHHAAAAFAFQQVVQNRVCVFFGVYRLTTELSTPFINQRWFYRTIGYKPDRRRVSTVTVLFAVLFAVTRNFMIVPFWCIAYRAFTSADHMTVKKNIPWLDVAFLPPPLILDCLNIYWANKAYRIGWRAAKTLWHADWRTDIKLAQAKLRHKLRHIRPRKVSDHSDQMEVTAGPSEVGNAPELIIPFNSDYSSSSNYSSETEYEPVESMDEATTPEVADIYSSSKSDLLADQVVTHRQQ